MKLLIAIAICLLIVSIQCMRIANDDNVQVPRLKDHRIIGGRAIDIAIHPHQISLRYKNLFDINAPYSHICGGSILSEDVILTAAHCIMATVPSQLKVVAGTNNNQRDTDGIIVPVKEIIMHEDYNPNTFDNDVAILTLSAKLPINNFTIAAIQLSSDDPLSGVLSTVTGWGSIIMGGQLSESLQEVNVPIVSNELCNQDYDGLITDSMLCAGFRGFGGADSCQGDSGGPLIIKRKLAGIVSWGYGCALPEYPGVYAKVSYLLPWIQNKLHDLNRLANK